MAVEIRRDVGGWMSRWDPAMAAQAVKNRDWPNLTVAQFALQRATATPERIQLIDGDLALSCAELYRRAQRLAGYFLSIGLAPGDVVSFQLPNWWEASVIDLAASMTGVVTNPIVPINRDAEVTYMLNESRTQVMFVPQVFRKYEYAVMMRRIAPALRAPPRWWWCAVSPASSWASTRCWRNRRRCKPRSQSIPMPSSCCCIHRARPAGRRESYTRITPSRRLDQDAAGDAAQCRRCDVLSVAGHSHQRLPVGAQHALVRQHVRGHARRLESGSRLRSNAALPMRLHGGCNTFSARRGGGGQAARRDVAAFTVVSMRRRGGSAEPDLRSRGAFPQLHSLAHFRRHRIADHDGAARLA